MMKTQDASKLPVTLTVDYICKTRAFGLLVPIGRDNRFAQYDKNAVTYYDRLKGNKDWGKDARKDGYDSTVLRCHTGMGRTQPRRQK